MDKSRIGVRFSILPRRHWITASSIAGFVMVASLLCASFSTPRYASSAIFSYDQAIVTALAAGQKKQLAAAQLAKTALQNTANPGRANPDRARPDRANPDQAGPNEAAFDLAHLTVTNLPNSQLRLEWVSRDPEETAAVIRKLAYSLANWTPKESGLQPAAVSTHEASSDQIGSVDPAANSHSGAQHDSAQPDSGQSGTGQPDTGPLVDPRPEEQKRLKASLAALDAHIQQLEAHLWAMRREGQVAASTHRSVNSGAESRQPPATDPGMEALRQRNEVEEQIEVLRKQRALVISHLEAITSGSAAPLPSAPVQAAPVIEHPQKKTPDPAQRSDTGQPNPKAAITTSVPTGLPSPMSDEKIFVLQQAPDGPNRVEDWLSIAGWMGIGLGLSAGALYLAIQLWRFRPIEDEIVLQELLPGGVIFIDMLKDRSLETPTWESPALENLR